MESLKKEIKHLVLELIDVPDDDREQEILQRLDVISPDPEYLDYIFQSDEYFKEDESFDIESFITKVFSYKTIKL